MDSFRIFILFFFLLRKVTQNNTSFQPIYSLVSFDRQYVKAMIVIATASILLMSMDHSSTHCITQNGSFSTQLSVYNIKAFSYILDTTIAKYFDKSFLVHPFKNEIFEQFITLPNLPTVSYLHPLSLLQRLHFGRFIFSKTNYR